MAQQLVQQEQLGTIDADSLQSYTIGNGANGILKLDSSGNLATNNTEFRLSIGGTEKGTISLDTGVWNPLRIEATDDLILRAFASVFVGNVMYTDEAFNAMYITGNLTANNATSVFNSASSVTLNTPVVNAGSTILSFTNLALNEGDGNVNTAPDIRMTANGLITAAQQVRIQVDDNNDGNGSFVVAKGAQTAAASTLLFRIENNGTLHTGVANYELQVTDDDDIPNKKYVDDAIKETHVAVGAVSGAFGISLSGGLPTDISATITGATTISFSNVPASPTVMSLTLELTNAGSNLTWPASVKWPGGTEPSWSTSGTDLVVLRTRDGGTTWFASEAGIGYA